jgi:hypothetical protein
MSLIHMDELQRVSVTAIDSPMDAARHVEEYEQQVLAYPAPNARAKRARVTPLVQTATKEV